MHELNHIEQQLKMRKSKILGQESWRICGVMILLSFVEGEWGVLFEKRTNRLRQPGDICFPGGKMEAQDRDEQHTAVRETSEELGIAQTEIQVIGELDHLITPFQTVIYPYVGKIDEHVQLHPNLGEVKEVFHVPLSFLLETKPEYHEIDLQARPQEDFPFEHIVNGKNYTWNKGKLPEYFYFYEKKVVWGLTARILHHFINLLKKN